MGSSSLFFLLLLAQFPTTPDQRLQDLNFTVNTILQRHPAPFARTPRATFDAAVNALRNDAPTLPTPLFYARLATIPALLQDAHTSLSIHSAAATEFGIRFLPLQFLWLDDGLWVIAAAPEFARANSTRLTHIHNTPIAEIIPKLTPYLATENQAWPRYLLPFFLRNQTILQAANIAPIADVTNCTFQTLAGESFSLDLPGLPFLSLVPALPQDQFTVLRNRRPADNYWADFLPDHNALYVRYRSAIEQNRTFPQFIMEFNTLAAGRLPDHLIIDLRANTGGNSAFFNQFLNNLNRFTAWRNNPNFRIAILQDFGTFSAGLDAVMDLRNPLFNSTSYGTPTGSRPDFYGDVNSFTLPVSRINLSVASKFTAARPWISTSLDTVPPDVYVSTRAADYFTRHDATLAAALARRPSGNTLSDSPLVNAATQRSDSPLAPNSIATLYGSFPPAPTLSINNQPARIFFANSSQINFLMPDLPPDSPCSLASNPLTLRCQLAPASPGIFTTNAASPLQPGAVLNQDSTLNSPQSPAAPGTVLQIFATGHGTLNIPPEAFIGLQRATVLFSGPPAGFLGLWQINAQVPFGLPAAPLPLHITHLGYPSNAVTVQITGVP